MVVSNLHFLGILSNVRLCIKSVKPLNLITICLFVSENKNIILDFFLLYFCNLSSVNTNSVFLT
jgi:hypothetical protein